MRVRGEKQQHKKVASTFLMFSITDDDEKVHNRYKNLPQSSQKPFFLSLNLFLFYLLSILFDISIEWVK
jgi:hypothetical protein